MFSLSNRLLPLRCMMPARRYSMTPKLLSLMGMAAFFLFAAQTNYQYAAADPSADTNDPVSVVARVHATVSVSGVEHLPVVSEQRVPAARFYKGARLSLSASPFGLSSRHLATFFLRGPPCA